MFETSAQTATLDAAIAKAQGEIEPAIKDKINPAFRSKYADLSACWAAVRGALSKHGISLTQWPIHSDDGRVHLITRLAHNGEWIKCEFSIPTSKPDAHGHGSAITYLKRFALSACLGLVADEDDDGNTASGVGQEVAQFPLGIVVAAIEAGDGLKMFALSKSDEQGFRSAFGRLNMKQKAICRTLEHEGVTKLNEYIVGLEERARADDSSGVQELVSELTDPTVKGLVWNSLTPNTRAYIKSIKEAA